MGPGNQARDDVYGGLGTRLGMMCMGPGNEARDDVYGAWERG